MAIYPEPAVKWIDSQVAKINANFFGLLGYYDPLSGIMVQLSFLRKGLDGMLDNLSLDGGCNLLELTKSGKGIVKKCKIIHF